MIRIARNISTNISRNVSRSIGTEPDLVLESFGTDAQAAYSAYDLGNQRGTVVESEGTYYNPVVRLRRDSDGTHKSFSGVEIGNNTALGWARETAISFASSVAWFDGVSNPSAKPAVKLDPSTDPTVSFSCMLSDLSVGTQNVLADISTETFIRVTATSAGNLQCRTVDSVGSVITTIESGLDQHTQYDVVMSYSSASKQWTVTVNGGSPVTHTHAGVFTLGNIGDIVFGDSFTGAGLNLKGSIWDIDLDGLHSYVGDGPNASNWIDGIGSNDCTVNALATYDYQDVNAYAATWYDQSGVQVVSTEVSGALENGNLDTAGTTTTFEDWGDFTSGTSTLNRDTVNQRTGDSCLRIDLDGSANNALIKKEGILQNGSWYRFSCWAKGSGLVATEKLLVDIAGSTDPDTQFLLTDEWQYCEFIKESDGTSLNVGREFSSSPNGQIFVDDVIIQEVNKPHNDATQATEPSQPKVVASGSYVVDANGNYSLSFDGTDDKFDVATISESQPISGFTVVDLTSAGGDAGFDILDGTAADTNRILLDKTGTTWRLFAGASLTGPTFTDDVDLIYFLANSTSSEIGLDGGTATTGDAGTNSGWASGLTIGSSISGSFMDGYASLILLYGADKSTDRSAIETSISDTITTALS